ncbi:phenol 2-monooxygenase [Microbacterium sp. oral taxon 186 str. F0373]|uniref:FAD-dependent monooxygenase n=1 Tax=Microbacterium sp. oral taxon 186 TaxID=712383 RepID=UPI00034E73FD|nr:FAD-dependent monooxygenase [Microbacterium sp. oral taxon 186]EPD86806.1 phenol 2-monooxygenase [Microbacterium sp. oral taxon 186 str. F0373]
MQFHHHGYVSADPRVQPAAGTGIDRAGVLPDEVDVLIVGSGPAGMLLAAQLSQYPGVLTRIVERREGRLALGQADGIQPRSVETFQAFGFAERIIAEAYNIGWMNFWGPDPANPGRIVRRSRTADYAYDISEFPHLIVNQARVLDYFAEAAAHGPARIAPDYGVEFVGLRVHEGESRPVEVRLRHVAGEHAGEELVVRANYVVGCDGARSGVRAAIGRVHVGDISQHAWGVMDVLVETDFPDWRIKCAINAEAGNILHIPREGGYLSRIYVDLGAVADDDDHRVRQTPVEEIIRRANEILHPYTLEVKSVAWHSVYEVGHRVTDGFDDALDGGRDPRVFLTGDACHTHSAKAGQGMNVSMQDGFNLGWKLGSVLTGLSPASLLSTYTAERRPVAQQLIDFDKEWSTLMARKPEEISDPADLATYYLATAEFPSGFMTTYAEGSGVVAGDVHQHLATGFPVGKRFKSAPVTLAADGNAVHLGHHAKADGRWRLYAFADRDGLADDSPLARFAAWLLQDPGSPVRRHTPTDADIDAVFDAKVIYQQGFDAIDVTRAPAIFRPRSGALALTDWEKVFAAAPSRWNAVDIFDARGLSRDGVVVVVRPDQYVAAVLPLEATDELADFFARWMLPAA